MDFCLSQALSNCSQLLWVEQTNPEPYNAQLKFYQRTKGRFEQINTFHCVIGKNGLANGYLNKDFNQIELPFKQEGDMRSPIGLYPLTSTFGYDETILKTIKMPYQHCTDGLKCIDDHQSKYYNQIIDINIEGLKKDWSSKEDMLRTDEQYFLGCNIGYNCKDVKPKLGSCIFLHCWKSIEEGTAGCVALEKNNVLEILRQLDTNLNPMIWIGNIPMVHKLI